MSAAARLLRPYYTDADASGGPLAPKAAPSLLTATAVSSSQINLAWTSNSIGETGFLIERSPSGVRDWFPFSRAAANATSFNDTGLTEATTYYYRVRSIAGKNTYSAPSNTANDTTLAPSSTFMLLETGTDYLLLESGDKLIL